MRRRIGTALLLAMLAGAARVPGAAAEDMQVIQGGEHFEVQWSGGPRDNLAGGGSARMVGGGEDRGLAYEPGSVFGQRSLATMSGGGEDRTITRRDPDPPATMLAQPVPGAPLRRR
ncbi:hypothetical protein [Paracraurococcus lichenis]|uniref:Uncharacterized protein n=1 Tax=Paracraurococcus lichenis TaxID=3064888 RepID=A0ABT9EAU4_9PROT|nr:hypothetical protein [Paracraurococcus sp. LOR1-02]MDO9713298.1 hypothetical protein [Paracraurococcus sp. LOR1-02]